MEARRIDVVERVRREGIAKREEERGEVVLQLVASSSREVVSSGFVVRQFVHEKSS